MAGGDDRGGFGRGRDGKDGKAGKDSTVPGPAGKSPAVTTGVVAVPLIAVGKSADVPMTFVRPMPSTSYALSLLPSPALILGAATLTEVTSARTTTGTTLRVTPAAGLSIALGSTVAALVTEV